MSETIITTRKNTECLVCGSKKLSPLKGYYELHQLIFCSSCSFVFVEQIPPVEELNTYYSDYTYTTESYLSPLTIKSYNRLLDEFEPYRKTNKILDLGCGMGYFLAQAKKRGWDVYGSEYSAAAIPYCEAEGIKMTEGQLQIHAFNTGEFDIITSFEVIEHLNNPKDEVALIHHFLRNGGLFYCTTPNFNSYLRYYLKAEYNIIAYPEHLSFYTRKTLGLLFKNNGFKKLKIRTTGISITRIKTSKNLSDEKYVSPESADEKIRVLVNNPLLQVVKVMANGLLSVLGIGMTLKGYFVKK